MFVEFLYHLLLLDIAWILGFFLDNLVWAFALAAISYTLFGGKQFFYGLAVLTLVLWIDASFETLTGWTIFAGGFMTIYFLSSFFLMTFAYWQFKTTKAIIYAESLWFYVSLIGYNLFLVG